MSVKTEPGFVDALDHRGEVGRVPSQIADLALELGVAIAVTDESEERVIFAALDRAGEGPVLFTVCVDGQHGAAVWHEVDKLAGRRPNRLPRIGTMAEQATSLAVAALARVLASRRSWAPRGDGGAT